MIEKREKLQQLRGEEVRLIGKKFGLDGTLTFMAGGEYTLMLSDGDYFTFTEDDVELVKKGASYDKYIVFMKEY